MSRTWVCSKFPAKMTSSFVMDALLSKTDSPVRDLYWAEASKPAKLSMLDAYLNIKTKIRVAHQFLQP